MFQLTAPLTPASGRAGSQGGPGPGGAVGGGKGAIDLPNFMTFALPGAAAPAPGNARQDPAGGGEAVPGGTIFIPPAVHPDGLELTNGMMAAVATPISAIPAMDPKMKDSVGEPVSVGAPVPGLPARRISARADDVRATAPKKARPASPSDAPVLGDRGAGGAVSVVVNQRHPDAADTDAAPIDSNATLGPSVPFDAARMPAAGAPIPLGPPTIEARAPAVGGSPDTINPATKPVPRPTDAAVRTVERRRDAAGRIAITTPVMAAPSVPAPSVPASAIRSEPIAALPVLDPVSTTSPAAQPLAVTSGREARPVYSPPRLVTNDAAVIRAPASPAPSSLVAPSPLPDAERPVGETLLRATPVRGAVGGVSLGTIAQMLGVVVPAPAGAMPTDPIPAAAAASVQPSALTAMPASVATFLASVAPRTFATPLLDTPPGAMPDALTTVAPRPATVSATAVVSLPTAAAPANSAPIVILPAGQLFAEAIHAATGQRDRLYRAPGEEIVALAGTASAPALATTATVVTDRAPLDLTQAHWPAKMIERIEVLRDAADAQDTRIKLIPDALGAIDVSMRRDGDTVRVHLAAERPETRAMIADAQPRLAELGEQRGLKIAASSGQQQGQAFGQSGAQDFHQPRGNPAPQQPARPASARASDQPVTDDDGDQRLA